MPYRSKTKLDANHKQICDHLKLHGVWVHDCASSGGGLTDLIVFWRETAFLEIKTEKKAQLTRAQIMFIMFTPAPVGFVQTENEALEFAKNPRGKGLTLGQKNKLGGLLFKAEPKKQKFEFRQIQELLGIK